LSTQQAQITAVLARYLSATNVRVILQQAFRDGAPSDVLSAAEGAELLVQVERGLALFLPPSKRDAALNELRVALRKEARASTSPLTFDIRLESDISTVRAEARRIIELMGANGFAVQKVVTIVSELARNMVSYAGGGVMTLTPLAAPDRGITINAKDTGTGIPNVDLVMSGTYRSRTGLGRGLLGCKRLADKFSLASDKTGTRIEAEVRI
jgi:serine/threonine-protein kinase RsbT